MKIFIIGVGLIGGSLGLALKKNKIKAEVIGWGRNEEKLKLAKNKKAIDDYTLNLEDVKNSDFIILSLPVGITAEFIEKIIPFVKKKTIITEVCSVKAPLVKYLEQKTEFPEDVFFVFSHPMAGSEKTGIENTKSSLFNKSTCIVSPTKFSSPESVKEVSKLWTSVGAKVLLMEDPNVHDFLVASASHLPHLLATALVNLGKEINEKNPDFSKVIASSFQDATRVARSSPQIWIDVYLGNKKFILESIKDFENQLKKIQKIIEQGDRKKLLAIIEEGIKNKKLLDYLNRQWKNH